MEAILLLVVLVAGYFLYQKVTGAASQAVSRKVLFRGSHERGQKAVHTGLVFTADCDAAEVTKQVRAHFSLPTTPPAVVGKPYIQQSSAHQIVVGIGNKFNANAELILSVNDQSGSGCIGVFAVKHWTESDGIVTTIDEIERLRTLVREAVLLADPGATFSEEVVE